MKVNKIRRLFALSYKEEACDPDFWSFELSGCVNKFQPSPNLVKILKSNLAACGETPSFGSALTPISCRHT